MDVPRICGDHCQNFQPYNRLLKASPPCFVFVRINFALHWCHVVFIYIICFALFFSLTLFVRVVHVATNLSPPRARAHPWRQLVGGWCSRARPRSRSSHSLRLTIPEIHVRCVAHFRSRSLPVQVTSGSITSGPGHVSRATFRLEPLAQVAVAPGSFSAHLPVIKRNFGSIVERGEGLVNTTHTGRLCGTGWSGVFHTRLIFVDPEFKIWGLARHCSRC